MVFCLKLCFGKEKKKRGFSNPKLTEKSLDVCSESCSRGRFLGEDRISFLPQEILWFILSFLAPKEVVKTSILSHRWLALWVRTPILDLRMPDLNVCQIGDHGRRNYVKWVNCVLRRHKGLYLEEFKIGCDLGMNYQKDIDEWLIFALERKVQRLELNLCYYHKHDRANYVFPGRFLNLNCGIRLPQFDLKCLKSLSLEMVDVTGEVINFILQDCPFLERLKVFRSPKLVDLVISNPTLVLKYLQIKYCPNLEVLSISNFNLVSLEIPSSCALTLTNIPMLVELCLLGPSSILSDCVSRASSCFSQLKVLNFNLFILKDVTELSDLDQLTNLKRLVIGIVTVKDVSLLKLISMMNFCPHLEEFVLKLSWACPKRSNRTICDVKRLGSSSSFESKRRLKVFEFLGYYGRVSDVEMVMHVAEEYGSSLEKIIIDPRDMYPTVAPRSSTYRMERLRMEQEARSCALQQFEYLRESIPQHVHLRIR